MSSIAYKCKVCGQPGHASYDDVTPASWVKSLAPLLTCNRCYDFWDKKNRIERIIKAWLMRVNTAKILGHPKLSEITEKARGIVIAQTKAFAQAVCRHYAHPYVWEPDFVDQCMDRPDKIKFILAQYERLIKTREFSR